MRRSAREFKPVEIIPISTTLVRNGEEEKGDRAAMFFTRGFPFRG